MDRLTPSQHGALERFLTELELWRGRMNLTAVSADSAWGRLIEPSLHLLDAASIEHGARVIDLGSGAGIPGLVLAVARPDLSVTLLDADRRKAAFLEHVAGLLRLRHVGVAARRAELAGRDSSLRERFDVCVSRAAAPPAVLCELALPFVRVGGRLLAVVANATEDAARARTAALACGGGAPVAHAAGVLVVLKVSATPAEYPRRTGVPARRPIG